MKSISTNWLVALAILIGPVLFYPAWARSAYGRGVWAGEIWGLVFLIWLISFVVKHLYRRLKALIERPR